MKNNNIQEPLFIDAWNATDAFVKLVSIVGTTGDEISPRNKKIKERLHTTIRIEDPKDRFVGEVFSTSEKYLAGEMLFYLWNRTDLKGIGKLSDFWNHISDDMKTVRSAYGYIIREKHGFDQIQYVINMLKKDPDTRKAVIQLKTPYEPNTKDNICTLALIFHIRKGKLHMESIMRGNDIVYGFRYNVFFFSLIQEMIANELNIPIGTMTHHVSSMHIYENHFYLIKNANDFLTDLHAKQESEYKYKPSEFNSNEVYFEGNDLTEKYKNLIVPKYSELKTHLNGNAPKNSLFNEFYKILGVTTMEYKKEMEKEK